MRKRTDDSDDGQGGQGGGTKRRGMGALPLYSDFLLHSQDTDCIRLQVWLVGRTLLCCACCGRHAKKCLSNLSSSLLRSSVHEQGHAGTRAQRDPGM